MVAMKLYEPCQIGGSTAQNRLVALPMESNDSAPDGSPSERTIQRYRELARGQWGIIMIESVAPSYSGRARERQLVLTKDTLDGFRRLVDAIRAEDDRTLLFIQLNHAGRYALKSQIAYHHEILDSWHRVTQHTPVLTVEELDIISQKMCWAADCATQIGVHGADLKVCHGYLGIELMRPANQRNDRYGSTFQDRARLIREMLATIGDEIKGGFLAGSRISLLEDIPGGLGDDSGGDHAPLPEDLGQLLGLLRGSGASWICETAGNPYLNPGMSRPVRNDQARFKTAELHHRLAARVKHAFPDLSVVGMGYTLYGPGFPQVAENNISDGRVDFIGLGRQNFADPETPRKLMNGDSASVNWCKACVTNNCAFLLRHHAEAGCIVYNEYYRNHLKALKQSLPDT